MTDLTALEYSIIKTISKAHHLNLENRLSEINVRTRENTGAGRYVYFEACVAQGLSCADGDYDGGGAMVECPSVPNGLGFILTVEGGMPVMLEIATYGNVGWAGEEEGCRVI